MSRPAIEEEDKPLDPSVERVRRKLVRFFIINIGLLFIALMAVLGGVVYKSRTPEASAPVASGDIQVPAGSQISGEIVLPVGAKVMSQALSGNRISIDAELVDGSRTIFLYDIAERRLIGQFQVRNK
ncbi:fimbrial protein [Aminobacter sp. UC22_36]|uniref:fimbrial protein n=1 Tax=Aminobacter sp. UC22_36 TaxID=3374549 RepID=UPI0037579126